MDLMSALVLYVVIWVLIFFIVLPVRVQTQDELDHIVPGTHASAPVHHHLRKKALLVTLIACLVWALACGLIISDWVTLRDIDVFGRMDRES
ncbi:MAG: DUF1467 family protein [Aestuariivita sp.]|nr:DUF1467 family protein [Aestuariivita sp.]